MSDTYKTCCHCGKTLADHRYIKLHCPEYYRNDVFQAWNTKRVFTPGKYKGFKPDRGFMLVVDVAYDLSVLPSRLYKEIKNGVLPSQIGRVSGKLRTFIDYKKTKEWVERIYAQERELKRQATLLHQAALAAKKRQNRKLSDARQNNLE